LQLAGDDVSRNIDCDLAFALSQRTRSMRVFVSLVFRSLRFVSLRRVLIGACGFGFGQSAQFLLVVAGLALAQPARVAQTSSLRPTNNAVKPAVRKNMLRGRVNTRPSCRIYVLKSKNSGDSMNKRHTPSVNATLCLLLAMAVPTLPLAAKSSPRSDNSAITSESTGNTAATPDRSADPQDTTTTTNTRRHMREEKHHNSNKKRGVIIGGTALTGMLVGASVAGPIGALAGAGVGAGVGMVLAHIF
jgi:hypothetical protein